MLRDRYGRQSVGVAGMRCSMLDLCEVMINACLERLCRTFREHAPAGKPEYEISLKYFDGEPVIRELKRVSTPGRRVYTSVKGVPQVRNGLGVSIVSTSRGVMSDSRARSENVGGEVLCTVF